jgi:hypothetical protein
LPRLAQGQQIDEDELRFLEAVHFSPPTADPVVTGLDILDEDDRTPGLDPDRIGAQQSHTDMHATCMLTAFCPAQLQVESWALSTPACKFELSMHGHMRWDQGPSMPLTQGHAWPVVGAIILDLF